MSFNMQVDKCPSGNTVCSQCSRNISTGSLRAKKSCYASTAKYYHLSCFKPAEPRAVDLDRHVTLKGVTEDWEVAKVRKWVEKWNSRFIAREETLPRRFRTKGVETVGSALRRLLLETFAYLELREIEQVAAFVSKEWFHVTRDNEFWKARYLSTFHPADTSENDTFRSKFIVQNQSSCWICHLFVPLNCMKMMCPLRKRPLCLQCSRKDRGRIITLNAYFKERQVSASLVARLRFKHFIYRKFKHNYIHNLADTIIPYAEKRRRDLLNALQAHKASKITAKVLNAVMSFDVVGYYQCVQGSYGGLCWSIGRFCGKNDQYEDLETSWTQFLSSLGQF